MRVSEGECEGVSAQACECMSVQVDVKVWVSVRERVHTEFG